MKEIEKMRAGVFYRFDDAEVVASANRANALCARLQTITLNSPEYRDVIEELVPNFPTSSCINPPFHCDHGHGLKIGENVFVNFNATMLDGGFITIGSRTKIGPNCQLVTPNHPMDYMERRLPQEKCSPITIGEDCWLGAGVIVCPGVSIGNRSVVGAGSVVVKDVPDDCLVVGNPARVVRKLK